MFKFGKMVKTETTTTNYSDNEIIVQVLEGNTALYEMLIRRANPFLYRIGRGYGFSHEETEDLMQESFVNAYYGLQKFEMRSSFRTWIGRIMLNNCYHRKQKLNARRQYEMGYKSEMQETTSENAPLARVTSKELAKLLEAALSKLNEEHRMVFVMRELNCLSTSETAVTLGISESNVKTRLNRAKAMLRTGIEKLYSAEDLFEFNLIYCNKIVQNVLNVIGK